MLRRLPAEELEAYRCRLCQRARERFAGVRAADRLMAQPPPGSPTWLLACTLTIFNPRRLATDHYVSALSRRSDFYVATVSHVGAKSRP
jgi:hypothetical protein